MPQLHAGKPARDKVRGRFGEKEEVREGEEGSDQIVFTEQNNKVRILKGKSVAFFQLPGFSSIVFERPQSSAMYLGLSRIPSQDAVTFPCFHF